MEARRRSVLKAFSWRFTATITTMLISFLITGNLDMALKIGGIEVFAKMLLYYIHERGWAKIQYGVPKQSMDYQI